MFLNDVGRKKAQHLSRWRQALLCLSQVEQTVSFWVLVDGISAVSGSLRVVLLVAVQLVRIVGGHVGEVLENVLVGFISCKNDKDTGHEQQQK